MRDVLKRLLSNFWVANTGLSVPRKGDWIAFIVGFIGMCWLLSGTLLEVYSLDPEQLQRISILVIVIATLTLLISGQLVHLWYQHTNQEDERNMYSLLIGCIVALPATWIVLSYLTQYH